MKSFTNKVDVIRYNLIDMNTISIYDKIIISPGPGLPSEYPLLNDIIRSYYQKKSILGICLGHQAIAQYFGAQLENLPLVKHGVSSKLYNKKNTYIFKNLPNNFKIGHYHSWVVSHRNFPLTLEVTSTNSENIITSFKHKKYDVNAMQFHPESILTEYGKKIIQLWLIN